MSKGYVNIIKGKFLIQDGAIKNWTFIVFCAILALFMIYSSHSAEKKVLRIAELKSKAKELNSEFVETKKQVMLLKMESNVATKMLERGIKLSKEPPIEIIVTTD
jgi:tRNA threonylcarbamoyladenosine modification (KEOPS) complex Cgi121 subunit